MALASSPTSVHANLFFDSPGVTWGPARVSLVVCVYNEEKNLPHFLKAVQGATGPSFRIREMIFVASGCTDQSVDILQEAALADDRIRLVVVARRDGKASALRMGLSRATQEIVLLENADTVPAPGAYEALLSPFQRPGVGLVTAHPRPADPANGFVERLGEVLWEVHDRISTISPKAGEAFAFRRTDPPLDDDVEDDDTFVGIYVGSQGCESVYARDAIVYNRPPSTFGELSRQRYRINRQILGLWRRTGFTTSTWNPLYMVRAIGMYLRDSPRRIPEVMVLVTTESLVRIAALVTVMFVHQPLRAWAPLDSTKRAIDSVGH
jgi:biofilm PGA synthesis N-glycosyltransferase PgaC